MTKIVPVDQKQRDKIANELDKNILVEAGAGSGKTTSLVQRMVNQILSGCVKVNEMVAITFTRKAADELNERFQIELENSYRSITDNKQKANVEQALLDLDQCFLGTIHSFCAKLLKERPVEGGVDPNFKELDELQDKMLQDQVWESFLLDRQYHHQEELAQLKRMDVSALELKDTFCHLTEYPDVEIVRTKTDKPNLQHVFSQLKSLVNKAYNAIPEQIPDKGYDDLQKVILRAKRKIRFVNHEQDTSFLGVIKLFEKAKKPVQKRWKSKEEAKEFQAEFEEFIETKIQPIITAWREYTHYYIITFLTQAVRYYEERKKQLSTLNFQDLLMQTAAMLKHYPEVRTYFQDKFQVLMVDEFQDTDPIQAEIVFYLTGENMEESDWRKLIAKPGALFVVGDPKQSIYRFRRADIDTYNLVKDLIEHSGGEVLELTANFRSLQSIADGINLVFQRLLPEEKDEYQAQYRPLDTVRQDGNETVSGIKLIEIPATITKKDDVVQEDAERMANYIAWALKGNIRLERTDKELEQGMTEHPTPKDFMILLRYRESMEVYTRTLEEYGIPTIMSRGSSLKDSYDIQELLKLLKLLDTPEDQVYLVAVLKGLFFGLSDDVLYQFKQAKGSFHFYAPVPEEWKEEYRSLMVEAYVRLQKYHNWTRRYSPTVALEKIILNLGLVPFVTATSGKSETGNVYQMLELLRKAEVDGMTDFSAMVKQIETILESDIDEELNILAEEQDAVRIMNVHKAKGLEAPVVFLAHPMKKVQIEDKISQHIQREEDQARGYFTFSKPINEYNNETIAQPVNWEEYKEEEFLYLKAEEIRLVYVAATRAKNMLVISCSAKNNFKNPWEILLTETNEDYYLEIPDELKPVNEVKGGSLSIEDLLAERETAGSWQVALRQKSYELLSPTDQVDKEQLHQIKRREGGGVIWGTMIHQLFETLIKRTEDIDTAIERLLEEYSELQKEEMKSFSS
jgi:ATP-dependent helicase/nuclease subunit A